MRTRRTTTAAAAAATFLAVDTAAAGPAAAADGPEQGTVDVLGCVTPEAGGDGTTEVVEGPTQAFLFGWGTGTRGLLTHFLKSQETTVTVRYDGQPPVTQDLSNAFSAPVHDEAGPWTSELLVPLGDLEAGDSVEVTIDRTTTKPSMDQLKGVYRGLIPAGTTLASGTCTITVVEA
ncbi:hypothetical protein SAMN04488107_4071 [Geodermatophilus saharensis]|uniref:Uncharacterized protein n=1 Tax=Geodermatophilus saharensis TaxID=1137994 RepID=A0A239HX68_9ACTN|nr:hypothetical protein [Geodermatophilus saharensis]SNS85919.1 hypothetical protein SAMN04488107_4071 [Geodermatophilus saharensis]